MRNSRIDKRKKLILLFAFIVEDAIGDVQNLKDSPLLIAKRQDRAHNAHVFSLATLPRAWLLTGI